MKNGILSLLLVCTLPLAVGAQIVLTSHSYPEYIWGSDSLKVTVHNSLFPVLGSGPNQLWDLSVVTDSVPLFWGYRVASSPYQYADSEYLTFSGFPYQANVDAAVNDSGIFKFGTNVQKKFFSLTTMTLGPVDSFYIPAQIDTFSSPRKVLSFPAAYGSSWSCAYHYDFNFLLTYQTFSFYKVPGLKRTYVTEKDSVTGWGGLRIPDATGSPTPFLDVLQVQRTTTSVDSFFFNGAVMPGIMLTFFSVQQAAKDTVYEKDFYRTGEVTPLAQVLYHDAAYSQPYKATTLVQHLEDVGVPGNACANCSYRLFPNPAKSGIFSIEVPFSPGQYHFYLTDCRGTCLLNGILTPGINELFLPQIFNPGFYLVRVIHSGSESVLLPLVIGQ